MLPWKKDGFLWEVNEIWVGVSYRTYMGLFVNLGHHIYIYMIVRVSFEHFFLEAGTELLAVDFND